MEEIASTRLFNPAFYSRMTGAEGGLRTLIRHYLDQPPASRVSPSPRFDPSFYRETYPDVAAAGMDPFVHYVFHGLWEQRYPSFRRAEEDARAIKASGLFDEALYRQASGAYHGHGDVVISYLLHGAPGGVQPNRNFDDAFVANYYDALRHGYNNLFAFFCHNHRRPWCYMNAKDPAEIVSAIGASGLFDRAFYRRRYLPDRPELDEVLHYCTEGYMRGFDPSPAFSTDHYFRSYADIARAEMNPLFHYARHGKGEGRKSSASLSIAVENGAREASPDKPWVLIVSHEASLTGAPIVGLRVAERVAEHANVVSWVGRDGPLSERYRDTSVLFVRAFGAEGDPHLLLDRIASVHPIEFAVVNSIVSRAVMPALIDGGVPIVSLVHEFAEYAKPTGWVSGVVLNSTEAVVPARVVEASLARELADLRVPDRPTNVVVRPQGRCEFKARDDVASLSEEHILTRLGVTDAAKRPRIVLGCGAVQIRKGVDLFIETARQLKAASDETVLFVWVGGGYKPKEEMAYSVYLADQVQRSGLGDTVHFFGEQPDLGPFWRLADVFYLPSRLDPFPNVALDAIVEGLPLVCFHEASGIAELAGRVPDSVFPVAYHDIAAAAGLIDRLVREAPERRRRLGEKGSELAAAFSVGDYADALFAAGRAARRKHDELLAEAKQLHADGLFDAAFFHKGLTGWVETGNQPPHRRASDLARLYAQLRSVGVELSRPFPGAAPRPAIVGRDRAAGGEVHAADVAFTHGSPGRSGRSTPEHRPLLHVHLGATPEASLLEALRRCASACTVLMTTDGREIAQKLTASGEAGSDALQVRAHPDFSDPLVSFLQVARTEPAELIGHLWLPHPDDAKGFRRDRISRALEFYASPERRAWASELFESDPTLGLLFPEHAAVRGSPRAQAVAGALRAAAGLGPAPAPERWPLDLVFWAHPGRISGLTSPRLMEESRRQALLSGLQDRLDGFGAFLAQLCEAGGSKARAAYDPGEGPTTSRPLILPH